MRAEILERRFVMDAPPTKSCHASTVLRLSDGRLLIAWFGGSEEGADDVKIWMAEYENGAFSPPRMMAGSDEPHWNPVLFQLTPDTVALYYKVGKKISHWRTMVRYSMDGGHSFTEAVPLVPGDAGGRGPVRSKPIHLRSGRILAPASLEDSYWRAFADRSDDGGATWEKSNEITIDVSGATEAGTDPIPVSDQSRGKTGVIQPTLWQSSDGSVHMLLRSTEKCVYRADSTDDGATFSRAYPTDLPNNNSGIDIARLDSGALLLAMNPVAENWGKRTPLSLMISLDGGVSFDKLLDLETEEGEFSYPAVIPDENGAIITYTHRRENIMLVRIQLKENER